MITVLIIIACLALFCLIIYCTFSVFDIRNEASVKDGHIYPKYNGYEDGFNNTTECVRCGRIALYEDQHPVNCCKVCGGTVTESIPRKFMSVEGVSQWVTNEEYQKINMEGEVK